ncbi:hypothetical protein RQP46_009945 [Phenoliferia psychrophenolica]
MQPEQVAAVGRCAPPQLEALTLRNVMDDRPDDLDPLLDGLSTILRLPKLAQLRHLRLPTVPKFELTGLSGLALMEECEERSISLLCRYGYLYALILSLLDLL